MTTELAEGSGVVMHPPIVRRSLLKSGLKRCVTVRKPLLRKDNKTKRLKYAQEQKLDHGTRVKGALYR